MVTLHHDMNEETMYRCKVIDIDQDKLIIDYPIEVGSNSLSRIQPNSKLTVDYIDKGTVYKFHTTVSELIQKPLMAFTILKPNEDSIQKIQRREYVRIETNTDLAVHSGEKMFSPFITVTQDISGGGASIILPEKITLKDSSVVDLYVVLKSKYSDFDYLQTSAEIVRTTVENGVRSASIKFLFDDERDRQRVIKYCFEIQRQNLKQHIL